MTGQFGLIFRVVLREVFYYTDIYQEWLGTSAWFSGWSLKMGSTILTSIKNDWAHQLDFQGGPYKGIPLYWHLSTERMTRQFGLIFRVVLKEGFHCTDIYQRRLDSLDWFLGCSLQGNSTVLCTNIYQQKEWLGSLACILGWSLQGNSTVLISTNRKNDWAICVDFWGGP